MQADALLPDIENIAKTAGNEILKIYKNDFAIYEKDDASPLTEADLNANSVITSGLKALSMQFPIISEEQSDIKWETRQQWSTYWLVDPLDGTKEFIKRNDEFTVNIALIHQGSPILGVVYVPVFDELYSGIVGLGAEKTKGSSRKKIETAERLDNETCIAMGSRSHANPDAEKLLEQFPSYELKPAGSSLKFCKIAEGEAHIYPRFGPTSEWDTGAAHAVLKAAGGEIFHAETKQPLRYNTKESYLNPYFIALNQPHYTLS